MLVFLLAVLAQTPWEAKVHFVRDPERKSGSAEGAIHVSGEKVRIDEDVQSILFDGAHLWLLRSGTAYELPKEDAPFATVPPASLKDLRKVGKERVGAQACDIWERVSETPLGKVRQRLDLADDARDFVWLRAATRTRNGATMMEVSEPKRTKQPDSLFQVPANYRKSTSLRSTSARP